MSKNCGGPCGDHARPAADIDMQASSEAPGRWVSVYAVPKMGEFKHEVRQFQKPYDNQQAEQTSLMV